MGTHGTHGTAALIIFVTVALVAVIALILSRRELRRLQGFYDQAVKTSAEYNRQYLQLYTAVVSELSEEEVEQLSMARDLVAFLEYKKKRQKRLKDSPPLTPEK
jgi:hypothetical protein